MSTDNLTSRRAHGKRGVGQRLRASHCELRSSASGLTLMELMVSLAILTFLVLMANSLMIGTHRTIRVAEDLMKLNSDMRACADHFRDDVTHITKTGFLAIVVEPAGAAAPRVRLVFTAAGSYRSMIDDAASGAAVVDYGWPTPGTASPKGLIWRRAMVLSTKAVPLPPYDHQPLTLSHFRLRLPGVADRQFLNTWISGSLLPPGSLKSVVNNATDAGESWPYLVPDVIEMKIQWTDGSRDSDLSLVWYDQVNPQSGRDANGVGLWDSLNRGPEWQDNFLQVDLPEYKDSAGGYVAMWTWRRPDTWPKALRLVLKAGDQNNPRTYEFIANLAN